MYLGVDIGGTDIKVGYISEYGDILKKFIYSSNYIDGNTTLLDDAIRGVKKFIVDNELSLNEINGIGISATGQISNDGKVIGTAGHIPNWLGVDLKTEFEKEFGIVSKVINDANSMIIAEKEFGAAKNYNNVIGVTIGTGIGGGIVVNGQLLTGSEGIAGEIGHILINDCEIKDSYNRLGSFEDAAATKAFVNMVNSLGYEVSTGKEIFDSLLKQEDVKDIYNKWLNNITRGLVSLIHIFNPEIIVIGGGISVRYDFINDLKDKVLKSVMPGFAKNLIIEAAKLGNDAGLLGAVCEFGVKNGSK